MTKSESPLGLLAIRSREPSCLGARKNGEAMNSAKNEKTAVNGFIIINKPTGLSSQAVVSRVRRALGADKAGHTGTLDPMASGVLPVLVGRGVKASEFMLTKDKHYRARLLLGIETDTEDTTGATLATSDEIPEEGAVIAAVASMRGVSLQTPPMYSAIKLKGKKLYELAREGITVEREPREITVHEISAARISPREYELDVVCSKGTYVRTLCADVGRKLGCGAAMAALCRTEAAGFGIEAAVELSALEALSPEERARLVRPTEEIFANYVKIYLQDFFARLARNGLEIYLKKIGAALPIGERVALFDKTGFFALGEVQSFGGEAAIKPIRQFDV